MIREEIEIIGPDIPVDWKTHSVLKTHNFHIEKIEAEIELKLTTIRTFATLVYLPTLTCQVCGYSISDPPLEHVKSYLTCDEYIVKKILE